MQPPPPGRPLVLTAALGLTAVALGFGVLAVANGYAATTADLFDWGDFGQAWSLAALALLLAHGSVAPETGGFPHAFLALLAGGLLLLVGVAVVIGAPALAQESDVFAGYGWLLFGRALPFAAAGALFVAGARSRLGAALWGWLGLLAAGAGFGFAVAALATAYQKEVPADTDLLAWTYTAQALSAGGLAALVGGRAAAASLPILGGRLCSALAAALALLAVTALLYGFPRALDDDLFTRLRGEGWATLAQAAALAAAGLLLYGSGPTLPAWIRGRPPWAFGGLAVGFAVVALASAYRDPASGDFPLWGEYAFAWGLLGLAVAAGARATTSQRRGRPAAAEALGVLLLLLGVLWTTVGFPLAITAAGDLRGEGWFYLARATLVAAAVLLWGRPGLRPRG